MSRNLADHVQAVRDWLAINVLRPPQPKEISISDVQFDWHDMKGSFILSLDDKAIEDRFVLMLQMNGKMDYGEPIFHSPLGAPASYAAVELTQSTAEALSQALIQIFPTVRAFGWHTDLQLLIDQRTPLSRRICDQEDFDRKKAAIQSHQFSFKAAVDGK